MEGGYVTVTEVIRNSQKNRYLFRQLSNNVSGESYDPPEENKVFFAYTHDSHGNKNLAGVASYWPCKNPTGEKKCHELTYLFVKNYFQNQGIGKKLLFQVEKHARKVNAEAPVFLDAAKRAVGFFEKQGYAVVGEEKECLCGAALFRNLVPMQKSLKQAKWAAPSSSQEEQW